MIFVVTALIGAIIASYTDLKQGIISNRLTMPLFLIGVFGHLALGGVSVIPPILKSILLIFILGYGFWMFGGWSAGDAKEFLFLAALLPEYPNSLIGVFNPVLGSYPFVLTIFINTFLAVFPFILLWGIYSSYKKGKLKELIAPLADSKNIGANAMIYTAAVLIVSMLQFNILLSLPLIIVLRRFNSKLKIAGFIAVTIYFLYQTQEYLFVASYLVLVFISLILFKLFLNSIKVVRTVALRAEITAAEAEEGMVLSEAIYNGGTKIESMARGLNTKELMELKKLNEEGTINGISIKKTMPFAPVILVGLLMALIIGDLVMVMRNG